LLFTLKHSNLKWSNLVFSSVPSGEFKGRKSVEIVGLLDKTCKLKVTNTTRRTESLKRDVICICEEDPLLCVPCNLIKFKKLCVQDQGRLYCYQRSSGKNMKVQFPITKLYFYTLFFCSFNITLTMFLILILTRNTIKTNFPLPLQKKQSARLVLQILYRKSHLLLDTIIPNAVRFVDSVPTASPSLSAQPMLPRNTSLLLLVTRTWPPMLSIREARMLAVMRGTRLSEREKKILRPPISNPPRKYLLLYL